jgi:hypothetical protein
MTGAIGRLKMVFLSACDGSGLSTRPDAAERQGKSPSALSRRRPVRARTSSNVVIASARETLRTLVAKRRLFPTTARDESRSSWRKEVDE